MYGTDDYYEITDKHLILMFFKARPIKLKLLTNILRRLHTQIEK